MLFEGAQGTHLDVDHGTYPFVTSSNATAGGLCNGLGVGPGRVDGVIGVTKAYTTRVGSGPMPTQLDDAIGERLRDVGKEFGATTGRPRRCGWFDGVAARYAVRVNGCDMLVVTKLDVLDGIDPIKVCVGYEIDGERVDEMPANLPSTKLTAVYEDVPGWSETTTGKRKLEDLPPETRAYLDRLAQIAGCAVGMASNGPERDAMIIAHNSPIHRLVP